MATASQSNGSVSQSTSNKEEGNDYENSGKSITKKPRVEKQLEKAEVELFNACENGLYQKVHSLMQLKTADVDSIREDGKTPLMVAAKLGFTEIVQCLISYEANALIKDNDGVIAVEMVENSPETLKCLTEETLFIAAAKGNVEVLQKMIDLNIDPNTTENDEYKYTPLLWACENGRYEVVKLLLRNGADINAISANNWNGLLLACRNGHYEVVKTLLENGISHKHVTEDGWTALMLTASDDQVKISELLIRHGADPFLSDKKGYTPLAQAAQDGQYEAAKLLVETFDMNVDGQRTINPYDWSPIMLATKNGHTKVVKYLVEKGADVHRQKMDGITVLHIASSHGYEDLVRYFCEEEKMNVDIEDDQGYTPLMYAAMNSKKVDVTQVLLNNSADVNKQEKIVKWSAAFFAIKSHHQDVLQCLLATNKVDLTLEDKHGNRLNDIAEILELPQYLKD